MKLHTLLRACMMLMGIGQQPVFGEVLKEKLFATPTLISAKISPDGNWVAYVGADSKGISNVFISTHEGSTATYEQVSFFTTPEIIQFFWAGDSTRILVLKEENGTGKLSLQGIHLPSKERVIYTTPFPQANAKVLRIHQHKAVIGLNLRHPHFHDLYLLDLDSGHFELLLENDHYAKFLISDDLEVILKMRIDDQDGPWTLLTAQDDVWMKLTSEEAFQTDVLSYDQMNHSVYLLDNRFSDTNQLIEKSLSSPSSERLLGSPLESDVDEVLFIQGKPKAYASYYEQKQWHAIDPAIEKDLLFLKEHVGPNFEVINTDQQGNRWVVSDSVPHQGGKYWLYDAKSQQLSSLHSSSVDPGFSKMYSMVVTARDGKQLVCYYTLPKEVDQGGSVDKPIPLVVFPHGGPFKVRDRLQFNPYHQWLASCGYAVLSVNFRLSSGFGKAFVNAGNGEWGGKAHLDVIDAVEACIAKGITEKGKLAVLGGSYGGYEALASLTFTPDYFTCAVAICGPSNLKTVLDNVPKFWEFTSKPLSNQMMFFTKQAFITSMGGNPDNPQGIAYLQQCSPLNYVDAIQAPLLLVHGKNDHVVAEKESEQFYHRMKANHKQVTYLLFPDEGHRFAKFSNKMFYLDQAERFLSQHLGGRYRPVDPSLVKDSTAKLYQ